MRVHSTARASVSDSSELNTFQLPMFKISNWGLRSLRRNVLHSDINFSAPEGIEFSLVSGTTKNWLCWFYWYSFNNAFAWCYHIFIQILKLLECVATRWSSLLITTMTVPKWCIQLVPMTEANNKLKKRLPQILTSKGTHDLNWTKSSRLSIKIFKKRYKFSICPLIKSFQN